MLIIGKFYYSKKQRDLRRRDNDGRPFVKLNSGKVVEYTEVESLKYINNPHRFDDSIFLGFGIYHHWGPY